MTDIDEQMVERTAKQYHERVSEVADRLRVLADRFEREARPSATGSVAGCPRYTYAAEQALHALTWGIANINAEYIVGAAGEADAAEAKRDQT